MDTNDISNQYISPSEHVNNFNNRIIKIMITMFGKKDEYGNTYIKIPSNLFDDDTIYNKALTCETIKKTSIFYLKEI